MHQPAAHAQIGRVSHCHDYVRLNQGLDKTALRRLALIYGEDGNPVPSHELKLSEPRRAMKVHGRGIHSLHECWIEQGMGCRNPARGCHDMLLTAELQHFWIRSSAYLA